jgi:uncharacterized secreted protein with C-terminal beta-propeller domain
MRRRPWIHALIALPLALPLAACTGTPEPGPETSRGARPAPALRLAAFDSCPHLLTDLRAAALRSVGPWGLAGGLAADVAFASRMGRIGGPASSARTAAAVPDAGHSGTNVHEQGADEPDIVKTDGRRIVTVADGRLRVIDPVSHAETGKLSLGVLGGDTELLLAGDRALVLVRDGAQLLRNKRDVPLPGTGTVQVLLVDLTGTPRLLSRYSGEGVLVDARQTGTVARVVLSTAPKIRFPLSDTTDAVRLRQNQRAVRAAPVDAWLPNWEITTGTQTITGSLACSTVSRPASFSGAALLRVLTFDLTAPALTDGSPVAMLADGDIVYGTAGSLYVANNPSRRFTASPAGAAQSTEIYKFALPATGKPVYVAGGAVPGTLLNQYALSEWDGHLRVATTDASGTVSTVRVLRDRDGKLAEVGAVGGLGKGERIYSVRFLGARGYVVTFRQTDPLYRLDLSDPAKPRVTGELKITGYSAHLQPVGDDRLIGIGQETSELGVRQGLQVSLFDVADPAEPRRLARHVVPATWSEAEFDPHAVLWWAPTGLLVVPVSGPDGGGALTMRVTNDGLAAVSRLATPGDDLAPTRRALVIGDELWTLSDKGLLASNLSTLDRTGWVPLA